MNRPLRYYDEAHVAIPPLYKTLASRLAFPVLTLLSRERSCALGLVPIDDERVIMALKHASGRVLDVGCGSNIFVKSYGNGVGVDLVNWQGCDRQILDAAQLPFPSESFDTVSYLACLNHIPNRGASVREAWRVIHPGGQVLVTMITPRLGALVHWLRERNDPDHRQRHIDHEHELLGMSEGEVRSLLSAAGFDDVVRKRFAWGLNSLYLARKPLGYLPSI